MPSIRSVVASFVAVALLVGAAAHAQQPSKGEQALKYRKSLYQVIGWNFGQLSAMAQGKAPYDAKDFATRAERIAVIAPMLKEAFPPESKGVANSALKPAMWNNRADFDRKMQAMIDATAALAAASKPGDFAKAKAAFFEAGKTCKTCHDEYKQD